jgi:hypothetical protein
MQPRAAGSRSSRSRSESAPLGRRPRTGLRAGSFEARKPGRLLQREPFGVIVAGTAPSAVQRCLVREKPPCGRANGTNDRWIFGSTDQWRRRFRIVEGTATCEPIKGNPFGGSWDRAELCSKRLDQPGPHDRSLLREEPGAGSGGTSADHHLAPIRRADHRRSHLIGSGTADHPSNDTAFFQGIAGTTSGETNDRRASGTERCTAAREGNALKGATPRAPPARNKAGRVRGGVQGTKR